MKYDFHKVTSSIASTFVVILTLLITITSCQKEKIHSLPEPGTGTETGKENPKSLKDFVQVNLVGSNNEYNPARIDPNLINAWGISFPTSGPAWVSSQGGHVSFVYTGEGLDARAPVAIPGLGGNPGNPSGQVFNGGTGFRLPNGNPARFIFAGLEGVISGWNTGNNAIAMVTDPGEPYTGIALAASGTDRYLYVTDFADGEVEVFDTSWTEVELAGEFEDESIPDGYSPYNVQAIGGKLYVMYAKVGADGRAEIGPGKGFVNIFNTDGSLDRRFISRGQLNAPWGVTKAPPEFWGTETPITNVILVGNFGDGTINAYTEDGTLLGQLRSHGVPIVIEGLWGIEFAPPTSTAINRSRLYFAAGPDHEEEGLFGYIRR